MPEMPLVGGSSPGDTFAPLDAPYILATVDSRLPDASVFPGVIAAGSTPPIDTRYLWRDMSLSPPALKFYDGITWQPFAQIGPTGPAGASPWSPLTADFTAGELGSDGLEIALTSIAAFARGAYIIVADDTGAQAFYRITASPSTLDPSSLTLTRTDWDSTTDSAYLFTVANASLASISGYCQPKSFGEFEPVVTGSPPVLVFANDDIVMCAV